MNLYDLDECDAVEPDFRYTFVVCAIFKNESHIMREWLTHYLARGVEHFYLVDDGSTDEYEQILHDFPVTLYRNELDIEDTTRQSEMIRYYFQEAFRVSKWTAVLDLDEFLYSPLTLNIPSILAEYEDFSQILVEWLFFGSNGHETQPASVVAGFTRRAPYDMSRDDYKIAFTKYIVRGQCLLRPHIHLCEVVGKTDIMQYDDASPPPLILNHYRLQSREWFLRVKGTRGDVNRWIESIHQKRDDAYFTAKDCNDIEDLRLAEQSSQLQV